MSNDKKLTLGGNATSELPLFRQESIVAQTNKLLGSITLSQPIAGWLIAVIGVLIAAALIGFVVLGSITKKTRVTGITLPVGGLVNICAPTAGVLQRVLVHEGQMVVAGDALFELSTEREGGAGELSALVAGQLASRQAALEEQRRSRFLQDGEKRSAIDLRVRNVHAQISQLDQEASLINHRRELAEKSLGKYQLLEKNGFVSSAQSQQKQEDILDIQTRVSAVQRERTQLQAEELSLQADRKSLANALKIDAAMLDQSQASLKQEMAENAARRAAVVLAPHSGVISGIANRSGQAVSIGQSLATLVSSTSPGLGQPPELEVHLFAPSRASGFIAPGQIVRIRFHAFPYQKFGLYEGTISDISRTPFVPSELPSIFASTILSNAQQTTLGLNSNEGLYRIRVKLKKQQVLINGGLQYLKPMMTLDADVIEERRRIWEWVLDPIFSVSH